MRTSATKTYASPFLLWQAVGARTVEMMAASAEVISHRSRRLALAGSMPSTADREELALMAREKMEAGAKSMMAMNAHLLSLGPLLSMQVFATMLRTTTALTSLLNSRTVPQWLMRQEALGRALLSTHARAVSAEYSKVADEGLKPFHAAAVANAKRLTKR